MPKALPNASHSTSSTVNQSTGEITNASSADVSPRASKRSALAGPLQSFRTAYSAPLRVTLACPGTGRTKQAFKDECDINRIMSRYISTGVLDFVNRHAPQYGDVTGYDFMEAQLIVANARSMFEELPATVRDRFDNDPALFLDFVADDKNRDEARELGLLRPDSPKPATQPEPPTPIVEAPKATPNA